LIYGLHIVYVLDAVPVPKAMKGLLPCFAGSREAAHALQALLPCFAGKAHIVLVTRLSKTWKIIVTHS